MRPAHVVEIVTPKKFVLNGLWFGPSFAPPSPRLRRAGKATKGKSKKPKRAIVWVHGMFSSAFSMRHIVERLVDEDTAVLAFNNRGFESVSEIKQIVGKKRKWMRAGTAQEVFTDCVDDIDGAIRLARKNGAKEIFLAGHSTGCQKSIYWAYKRGRGVKGIILLGPLSDFVGANADKRYKKTLALARKSIKAKRPHELLPADSYWHYADAQRFVSLYTPDSIEQSVFPYFDAKRGSKALRSLPQPLLVIFAGNDEYLDRPAEKIVHWFEKNSRAPLTSLVTKKGGHSFRGAERPVAKAIKSWIVKSN